MTDPVATVEKIVRLGLAIKDAVDTVRRNEEECNEIRRRVLRFSAILSQLQQTGMMKDSPAMSGALEDLEESLQHALELVTACQERSTIRRLITAGDLSKKFCRVKDDILNKVMLASFAINAQVTIVLLTIQAGGHPPPRQPEDAGVDHSTDDVRSELNDVENNVIAGSEALLAPLLTAIREFKWSELMAATNSFSDGNIIGQGGSFIIYKGFLKGGNIVAIKRHYRTDYSTWSHNNYERLLLVVSKLLHKNIVKFVRYCHQVLSTSEVKLFKCKKGQPREREYIWVEEYVANGTLQDIIHDSRVHWSSLFRIIQGIAQGLRYLHEQRVVHMDVKPSNILLESDMIPKITDFELSIVLFCDEITHCSIRGTMGYAAPEYLAEGRVSTKNDVYAFGITLLETVSSMCRYKPPPGHVKKDWEAWNDERMKEFDPALFEALDLKQIRRCMQIGLLCAQLDRARRPSMAEVLEMLNGNKKVPNPKEPARSDRWRSRWCGFDI